MDGQGKIIDTNLNYLRGMPDIANLYGQAHFSKDTIKIDVDKGAAKGVILTGGYVRLYDLDKYNNYADIDLELNSSVSDALRLIDNPPLGYTSEMGLKPDAIIGEADTKLKLNFELKNDLGTDEVKVNVLSDLKNVVFPKAFQNKTLSADTLKLEVNNQGLSLTGDAKLENIPLELVWNENFSAKKYQSRYKLAFKFNNAARQTLGVDSSILNPPYVDGYAMIDSEITVYDSSRTSVSLNAQLDKMLVDFSFLGFKKELNEPGNLTMNLDLYNNKLVSIPQFSLFKDDFRISGKVELTEQGNMKTVDISEIKGPKTATKARIDFS